MHLFVTGGSRGIGAAIVKRFTQAGWLVTFTYLHSKEQAENLAHETGSLALCADSTLEEQVQCAIEAAESRAPIDVLVNNSGISVVGLLQDLTLEDFHKVMQNNLDSMFLYSKAVIPYMVHRKAGKILSISSIWGMCGASCEAAYSASKAAMIGLTKALAKELAPSHILVNAIAPGMVDTEMNAHLTREEVKEIEEELPIGRVSTPEEIAGTVWFLANPEGDSYTGQVLCPNGGMLI